MGYGSNNPCPNCGTHHFSNREPCKSCGYKDIPSEKLPEGTLVRCNSCGCSYIDSCPTHGITNLEKVQFPTFTPKEGVTKHEVEKDDP